MLVRMLNGQQVGDKILFASQDLFDIGLPEIASYDNNLRLTPARRRKRDELIVIAACGELELLRKKFSEIGQVVKDLLAKWIAKLMRSFRKQVNIYGEGVEYSFPEQSCASWDLLVALLHSKSPLNQQVVQWAKEREKLGVRPLPDWYCPDNS